MLVIYFLASAKETYLMKATVLVLSELKKQTQRNVLKYFALFKNVAHSCT